MGGTNATQDRVATLPSVRDGSVSARRAQAEWAALPTRERLKVFENFRHRLANMPQALIDAVPAELGRASSDTLAAEVLPLLAACAFLEKNAARILRTRHLGRRGLPLWLWGVDSEVRREPFGVVLIIGPYNYPLLLPGVQTLQALAAGNAVIWKPGRLGSPAAHLFRRALVDSGLPPKLLRVTADSVDAGRAALNEGVDKVFFTGSVESGRAILRTAAQTITSCVVELSGCDAVVVLPSADLSRVVCALTFGIRLNGSATCLAPRRVLLVDADSSRKYRFLALLLAALEPATGVQLSDQITKQLSGLVHDARARGAVIHGDLNHYQRPLVLTEVTPNMPVAQADIFAPVLSVIDVTGETGLLEAIEECPFGLTASVFGEPGEALDIGGKLRVGTVLINDLIVPTADPRVPFGGRLSSGFGVTRGAEGLLEMTAVKVVSIRRGGSLRHYDPPQPAHDALFKGMIAATHAGNWRQRLRGFGQLIIAARISKREK